MDKRELKGLMPLAWVARKYKLPKNWLERESRAGRLPCLIADDKILFDEPNFLRALHRLAEQPNTDRKIKKIILGGCG